MKPGKLYIKIFLSFVLVLVITEVLIFGLFIFTAGRGFRDRFEQYTRAQVLIAKETVEEKIRSEPGITLSENESLRDYVSRLGKVYGAKVWLSDTDGTPLLKSFPEDISEENIISYERRGKDMGDFKLYRGFKRGHVFYVLIPTEIQRGRMGSLHILFEKMEAPHPEAGFAFGLIGIGVVIAILLIPISRLISKPIKRLEASAMRIAEGDLAHRALVKSRDEIGELGRSFNHMADRVERMIQGGRELTANISHELRSPLARIRVAEELIRERWERGEHRNLGRHLDDIREDIEELDRLIGSILLLSKLDIHEEPSKNESLRLSDLINELVGRFGPVVKRRDLSVMTSITCNDSMMGNKDSLRTAFSNIFDNAFKFTAEGGKVIIRMYCENKFVKTSITNSFKKLSEEDLTGIFEPFFRAEKSFVAGTGLGLAIAKKIIEKHGGSILAVNSEEGLQIEVGLPMTG